MAKTVAPEKVSRLDREFLENGSKKLTKLFAAIFFLFLIGVGNAWGADGDVAYTLQMSDYSSGTKKSAYAESSDLVFGTAPYQKTWTIPGNATLGNYFAVGGKSCSETGRVITGKSSIDNVIKQVNVNYSGIKNGKSSSLTVDSAKLEVGNSGFSSITETVKVTGLKLSSSSSASHFSFTPASSNWASGKYYRITIYCTTTGSNNSHLDITSIEFIEGSAGTSYTLTFKEWDGGGTASGSPSTGSVTENATSFSFGATAPSKTGHTIEGFYTNTSASSGVKVANNSRNFVASVTDWTNGSSQYTKGADANLYIKWSPKVCAITLDKGTSGTADGSVSYTYGNSTMTGEISHATKTGYHLNGYYTASSGGTKILNDDGTLAGNNISVSTTTYTSGGNWAYDGTSLTLYAQWTIDNYTVHWKVNGNDWEGVSHGSPSTDANYNNKPATIPTAPVSNDCDGTKVFVGWTNSTYSHASDAPTILFSSQASAPAITGNTTFHAVFANRSGGAVTWNQVAKLSDITAGTYVIENAGYALPSTPTTSSCPVKNASYSLTISEGVITSTVRDSMKWYLTVGTKDTLKNMLGDYLYVSGNDNDKIRVGSTKDGWTFSVNSSAPDFAMCDGSKSRYCATYSSGSDWRSYNSATHVNYGNSGKIHLFKLTGGYTYSNYATNCCEAPGTALSITSASSVVTGGTVTLTSTGGNGGTVTWSVVNGTGSATISDGVLTAGSVGTVTVKAHQNANTVLGTEYCAQDAEQAFTVVSSTINVTGVEVSPTTKAIVPGETFDITPTISPSNATDKSVSWSSSASDKASVSSGTVTGVAAGTANITCTTTDGSYTATTAVTVYAVTMQALDEDGNAIAVGGPSTPSRSGASISPAADAGNYVFKEWAISGASLGSSASTKSNTITNPTGAVTVTAKYYKPRTVKWSVNGNDSYNTGGPTTTVAYNGTISTVPTDPSGLACAGTFVAWTDATHNNGQTAEDDDSYYEDALYTDAGDFPNITAATTTFYAVFAEGGEAAVNTTMWSENWTGVTSGKKPSEYDGTGRTVYNSGTVTYTESGSDCNVKADTYAGGSSPELYIKGGEWWNIAYIPTGGAATLTLTYMSNNDADVTTTTKNVAVGTTSSSGNSRSRTITISGDVSYFDLKFAKSSNTRVDNVLLKVASVSLTNYVTECDPNIVKVTYNANSGTTSCTNTTTDKTEDFTVCGTEPTRDYYTFAGWLCSADDEVYAASATIDDAVIDADFSLTAQWTPVTYNITYNLHGGTTAGGNPTTYDVETATIDLADGTYGHNRFEGWYGTYNDGTGAYSDQVTSIPLGSHGDITLHAKWTTRHEIVFDADGETTTIYRADDEDLSASVAEQGSVPSDPSAPTACSSKVFVGWSESEIDDETDDEPADLMKPAAGTVDEDKHYYAVWAIQSSTTGPVTVFEDALYGKADNNTTFDEYGDWSDIGYVYGCGTSTEGVRVSSADNAGYLQLKANIGLASVDTIKFKIKSYGDSNGGKITLSSYSGAGTYDNGASAVFTTTNTSSWEEQTCILRSADNTTDISFEGSSGKYRVYLKDIKITKAGTVYTYSAYSTSCCATKVTLSQNDPENGTIVFGKTTVGTCGDKEVSLTITPANGYQLHTYSVATGDGKVATKSVSPAISLDNNSNAAQNITLTFADKANGAYNVTATFTEKTVTGWTFTNHIDDAEITSTPIVVYVGQKVQLDIAYSPEPLLSTHKANTQYAHTRADGDTYIKNPTKAGTYFTFEGKASTNGNTTSITLTHNDDSDPATFAKTVNVEVRALPKDKFLDLVHGVEFDDQSASITDAGGVTNGGVTFTYTAPGGDQSEWSSSYANTCEQKKVKLVGWVESEYADACIEANSFPTTDALKADGTHFFAVGATMTASNKTYYAVWAEIE